jgi:hypothetical protein
MKNTYKKTINEYLFSIIIDEPTHALLKSIISFMLECIDICIKKIKY